MLNETAARYNDNRHPITASNRIAANIHVARLILDPKLPISPSMIEVKATQDSDLGRVIHANSITLTPGTVSVELEGDVILVHAISQEAAEGTLEGGIDRRVTAL